MKKRRRSPKKINQRGSTLIEAGILIALLTTVTISVIRNTGDDTANAFCELAGSVESGDAADNLTYDRDTNSCQQDVRTLPPCPPGFGCP